MKLSAKCLDDLRALTEIAEHADPRDFGEQKALWELRKAFRDEYGITHTVAQEQADKYAQQWRRHA
jgi:hypothetical protein